MIAPAIRSALTQLAPELLKRSGAVFYTGRSAFQQQADLYILGLNPGGSPTLQAEETIARHLNDWHDDVHEHWSAYLDDRWRGRPPGAYGLQPRIAHMFSRLGHNLRDIPAANVVFVRSASEADLDTEKRALLRACWPVHEAVIYSLNVRAVLALGSTAGRWVRGALGATHFIGSFRETNGRGWTSEAHGTADGRAVITLTHPGRADWRNPAADPTDFVSKVIRGR